MKKIALAMVLALTAASPAPAASPAAPQVVMKDDAFSPVELTVTAGTTVSFVNQDDDAHTVTSTTGAFDSKGLDSGARWKYTFTKAGVYQYFCQLHPFMKGKIVVKAVRQ